MPREKKPNPAPPEPGGTFDPLALDKIRQETEDGAVRTIYKVIIDLNLEYPTGREGVRDWVIANVRKARRRRRDPGGAHLRSRMSIRQSAARRINICLPPSKVASSRNSFVSMSRRRKDQNQQRHHDGDWR